MSRQITSSSTFTARLAVALAALLGVVATSHAGAQEAPAVEWTRTSLTRQAWGLYTPASGALFVRTDAGLMRSDDAGETWREVPLPGGSNGKGAGTVVVDPTNHATIYANTVDGINKTEDDGATWRLILPADPEYPSLRRLVPSPANPRILYVLQTNQTNQSIRFLRSTDGGETWTEPDPALDPPSPKGGMPCYWATLLLEPHPRDENRLIRGVSCSDRGMRVTIRESHDGGTTWTPVRPQIFGYPYWLVGQQADAPGRLVLGTNGNYQFGGYTIERSDDGGATWTTLQEYQGGGVTPKQPLGISALAMDPTRSDRLLLAVVADGNNLPAAPLRLSLDGGQTWAESAPMGIGQVHDVAIGIDGKLLFATSETGVWRAPAP